MHSGISMVIGGLRSRGVRVPRQRVIDAMRVVDPVSQIIRRRVTTFRRVYSVQSPNSLWYVMFLYMYNKMYYLHRAGISMVYINLSDGS